MKVTCFVLVAGLVFWGYRHIGFVYIHPHNSLVRLVMISLKSLWEINDAEIATDSWPSSYEFMLYLLPLW